MFLRRKPPPGQLLVELEQVYNEVSEQTLKNLASEEKGYFAEALSSWKSLHTLLLYKLDSLERRAFKMNPEEAAIISDLKAIRDENVKHLIRLQLRLDEQNRKLKNAQDELVNSTSHNGSHSANSISSSHLHKLSTPSLRSSNPSSRSLGSNTSQRHMVKSLRQSAASNNYQLSQKNHDTVMAAASKSWTKPVASTPKVYDDDLFGDFDQTELTTGQWERLNSVGSQSSTATSDSCQSVNLIDLDDRFSHQTLEEPAAAPKKVPPPVPSKRSALTVPSETLQKTRSHQNEYLPVPLAAQTIPKPSPPAFSKSTSNIKESHSPTKKYTYTQPKPMNLSRIMQKSGPKSALATKKPTASAQRPRALEPTSVRTKPEKPNTVVKTTQTKQVKKSNITYNYKPMEKPKAVVKKNASPGPKSPPGAKSPHLDKRIDGNDSEEPGGSSEALASGSTSASGMSPGEQAALIKSIKGIDELSATQILNDIVVRGDEVYWDDIVGLESAKNSLKEAVVYPFLRPDLFRGLREPTRGMLLFGPPGTGKTMLARAVATESKSTFFSISSSSLTSKYLGESEKLVKALFLLAKRLSPSIVFIDEIDSLLGTRAEGEVESTRRIKNEFLVQWSELSSAAAGRDSSHGDVSRVLILGATNLPWGIDEAARRRFAKRVYIPLPEKETRKLQISKLLAHQKHTISDEQFETLMDLTEGFSGSDITLLAKDSAMGPLRSLGDKLLSTPTEQIRPIQLEDFIESLKYIRPSVSSEGLSEYEKWSSKFGSSGA